MLLRAFPLLIQRDRDRQTDRSREMEGNRDTGTQTGNVRLVGP